MSELEADQVDPGEAVDREALRAGVRAALADLPAMGRETLELYYFEERSCAEISDLLRIPQGTVKRRLHDARHRLRDLLLGAKRNEPTDRKPEKPRGFPL